MVSDATWDELDEDRSWDAVHEEEEENQAVDTLEAWR